MAADPQSHDSSAVAKESSTFFFFFFGINLCVSQGAKPHVALLVKVTSKLCNDMSMGPNTSDFYPHSPKAVVA